MSDYKPTIESLHPDHTELLMLASMVNGAPRAEMIGGFKMLRHYMVFLTLEERDVVVKALVKMAGDLKSGGK